MINKDTTMCQKIISKKKPLYYSSASTIGDTVCIYFSKRLVLFIQLPIQHG